MHHGRCHDMTCEGECTGVGSDDRPIPPANQHGFYNDLGPSQFREAWMLKLVELADAYREAVLLANASPMVDTRSAAADALNALERHAYNEGKAP